MAYTCLLIIYASNVLVFIQLFLCCRLVASSTLCASYDLQGSPKCECNSSCVYTDWAITSSDVVSHFNLVTRRQFNLHRSWLWSCRRGLDVDRKAVILNVNYITLHTGSAVVLHCCKPSARINKNSTPCKIVTPENLSQTLHTFLRRGRQPLCKFWCKWTGWGLLPDPN